MKRLTLFFVLAMLLLPLAALAGQGDEWPKDLPLNDGIVVAIQTLFGLGLMTVVNIVKALIKKAIPNYDNWTPLARHALMYAVTGVLSVAVVVIVLAVMRMSTPARLVLYSVYTWFYINQFWKMLRDLVKKHK